jgi:SSS family solute:Na+ symporter
MDKTLGVLDYLVMILYLAGMLAIGFWVAHRQTDQNNYFKGGQKLPAWAVGISLMATIISSVTFMAYPAEAFKGNWIRLVQGLMVPLVLLCIIWFIVPCYRRIIGLSAYEYFEKRFGYGARLYTSLAFSIMHFTKMGTVLYLLALAVASIANMNIYLVILGVTLVTIVYTLIGGIEAVVWTDVVQGFIFIAAALICVAVLLFRPDCGPGEVLGYAWRNHKMSVGPYDFSFVKLTFWVMAINGIFYALQKYCTDQTVVQRFLTNESDKKAIQASLLGVLLCIPVWTIFMLIGTLLWSYYHLTGNTLPTQVPEEVFPYFIISQLPQGITGLILVAVAAAAMSTLASDLNCLAAVGVEDYYRHVKKDASDKTCLNIGRWLVAVFGVMGAGIACLYVWTQGKETVLSILFEIYAIFSAGIAGLFVLGFFTIRGNRRGLTVGIITCIVFTAWAFLTSQQQYSEGGPKRILLDLQQYGLWNYPHHNYMLGVYSHLVLFGVGYLSSFFFKPDKDVRPMTFYGWLENKQLKK